MPLLNLTLHTYDLRVEITAAKDASVQEGLGSYNATDTRP